LALQLGLKRSRGNGIRWGIGMPDGPRGSIWRLWGNKKGDFYLAVRIMGGILKTSFHKDGNCHSGLTGPFAKAQGVKWRHMDRWRVDTQDAARVIQVLTPGPDLRTFDLAKSAKDAAWLPPPSRDHLAVVTVFISARPPNDLATLAPPPSQPIGILATRTRFCWAVYATNPIDAKVQSHIDKARSALEAIPPEASAPRQPGIRGLVIASNGSDRTLWELAWGS